MEGTGEAGEGTEAAEAAVAGGRRRPPRPILLVAAAIAGVMLLGGVALAARGGDPSPSPAADAETASSDRSTSSATEPVETTTTTLAPTTAAAVTEPAPTGAPPSSRPAGTAPPATPAAPRVATCFHPWPQPMGPLPTVVAEPGKSVAFGPPAPSCVDESDGCMVSIVLRWSDGYTEVGSAVLAEPGSYTVNGDRGTTGTFTVSDGRVCTATGGNYSNVWPPGT